MQSPSHGFVASLPARSFFTNLNSNRNRTHCNRRILTINYRMYRHVVRATVIKPGTELVRPPPSSLPSTGPLTPSQIETFFEQGYVLVPQLLPPNLLAAMLDAVPTVEAAKLQNSLYSSLSFRIWQQHPVFKHVATSSPVAAAAAQLTPVDTSSQRSLVAVKDAYFRMQGSNKGCGFHVDDPFFWPCPVDAPGPGVNAWIALHDVTPDGGGLTVAPASHGQSFVDCREAIKSNTCMLAELAPEKNERLERIAVSPLMKAGDVILHTRWLFHRGNPFKSGSKGESGEGISRYSVRYMPGEAVVNEITMEGGKFVARAAVRLTEADANDFPAVSLGALHST